MNRWMPFRIHNGAYGFVASVCVEREDGTSVLTTSPLLHSKEEAEFWQEAKCRELNWRDGCGGNEWVRECGSRSLA